MKNPRWTICTITTSDEEKAKFMNQVYNESGLNHEQIYLLGCKSALKEHEDNMKK